MTMICNDHLLKIIKNIAILVFVSMMTMDFDLPKKFINDHPMSIVYDDVVL